MINFWNFGFKFIGGYVFVHYCCYEKNIIPITNETLYSLYKCFPSALVGMFTNARERDKTWNNTENLNPRRKILKCTLPHNNARQVQWNSRRCSLTIVVCTLGQWASHVSMGENKKCNSPKYSHICEKKFPLHRDIEKFWSMLRYYNSCKNINRVKE